MKTGSTELRTQAGRFLWIGLAGEEVDSATRDILSEVRPAGIILFARNLREPDQVARLVTRAVETAGPLLVATDQEGGRVDRLRALGPGFPGARAVAATGRRAIARRHGLVTARVLRLLGIGVDFAPVLDLDRGHEGNGIGDRSFGGDPRRVAAFAGAFLAGLRNGGVAGCLKHFPGLGGSRMDSHHHLPLVDLEREVLEEEDLAPFGALLAEAPAVMISHALFPSLGSPDLPASVSPAIVHSLLRTRLGYSGPVISDDLEMKAVDAEDRIERRAVEAILAGCDLVLVCRDPVKVVRARDGIATALRQGEIDARRAGVSRRRIQGLVRSAGTWGPVPEPSRRWSAALRSVGALQREVQAMARNPVPPQKRGGRR